MLMNMAVKRAVLNALSAYENRRGGLPAPQPPALWGLRIDASGRLAWDGCALEDIGRRFGTPLHVVSRSELARNYTGFRDAFAARYPRVEIGFSYKTNPLPGVIRALHELGAAAEVTSHFELWLALRLGVPPARIVFNGPAKTPEALDLAVASGIKIINIDGPAEIARIEERAAHYGVRQRVGVRIVTSVGWASQFGFRLADGAARDAFQRIKACRHLVPCGLHLHLGTGLRDARTYFQATRETLDLALDLQSGEGVTIEHFDFGGGFNVPTVREFGSFDRKFMNHGFQVRPPRPEATPEPAAYAEGIVSLVEAYRARARGPVPEIFLEPGRALSSSAQCLLLTVLAVKPGNSHGKFAIVDGGRNVSMPLAYEYHELLATGRDGAPAERYTVFGPLCHPNDVVAHHRDLPRLAAGDILAVMDSGAYFIPNQMNFSHPRAAVVMADGGATALLRARESFEDVVRLDGVD